MDKKKPVLAHSNNKMAAISASKSVPNIEKSNKRPRSWANCSSKLHLFLNNIERSLMSQFQNHSSLNSEGTNTLKKKSHTNISAPITSPHRKGVNGVAPNIDATATTTATTTPTTDQTKSKSQNDDANSHSHPIKTDSRQQKDLALPTKSEQQSLDGNTTLNKQQHSQTSNTSQTAKPYHFNQPFTNTQIMYPSNQVPITTTANNGYGQQYNHQNMNHLRAPHYQHPNRGQPLNQQQNGAHLSPQYQMFHGLHQPSPMSLPILNAPSLDNSGQEIYANAPPKPRRYQYYDNPDQYVVNSMATNPSINMTAPPASTMTLNNNFRNNTYENQFRIGNQQHTSVVHQPHPYPGQFFQVPNVYQQQSQILYNDDRMNQQSCYPIPAQRQIAPLLTKSRSNLDFNDINLYKMSNWTHNSNQQPINHQIMHHQASMFQSPVACNAPYQSDRYDIVRDNQIAMLSNLQRSKSVTQLTSEMNHDPRDLIQTGFPIHDRFNTINPKFLAVSSASTTNLHMICTREDESISLNHNSQLSRLSSQHINSIGNHQLHQKFNHPFSNVNNQQGNQMYCGPVQRQDQQHFSNDWQILRAQTRAIDQQIPRQAPQRQQRLGARSNSAFTNGGKILRQSAINSRDGLREPTLDDKIRCLVIGEDNKKPNNIDCSSLSSQIQAQSSINLSQVDFGETRRQNDNAQATDPSWANPAITQHQKQQFTATTAQSLLNGDLSSSNMTNNGLNNRIDHEALATIGSRSNFVLSQSSQASQQIARSELFPVFHVEDQPSRMGNRQQRHYHVNEQDPSQQTTISPIIPPRKHFNDQNPLWGPAVNSQLIVDLTTPRVLAKTQTTLSSTNLAGDLFGHNRATDRSDASSESIRRNDSSTDTITSSNVGQMDSNSSPKDENVQKSKQVAPYYYSDLKSQEQRQALLSIVQQKSLSPPPQLLSRSAEQGSTRLASKSATLQNERHLTKHLYDKKLNNSLERNNLKDDNQKAAQQDASGRESNNSAKDDEDFIEFMKRSPEQKAQFGASEFNASDFVARSPASSSSSSSSSSSTSSSSSLSTSAARSATDQDKKQETSGSVMSAKGPATTNNGTSWRTGLPGGILKNSKNRHQIIIENNNYVNSCVKDELEKRNNPANGHKGNSLRSDRNEFNDVLGNVIDVDVCPMNNLSTSSPVNNLKAPKLKVD